MRKLGWAGIWYEQHILKWTLLWVRATQNIWVCIDSSLEKEDWEINKLSHYRIMK